MGQMTKPTVSKHWRKIKIFKGINNKWEAWKAEEKEEEEEQRQEQEKQEQQQEQQSGDTIWP